MCAWLQRMVHESGGLVPKLAVNLGALCDEAFNQLDIAGLDSVQKAFDGWRSLRRHILEVSATEEVWEQPGKSVAQILAQNAADYTRMMPFCPIDADVPRVLLVGWRHDLVRSADSVRISGWPATI